MTEQDLSSIRVDLHAHSNFSDGSLSPRLLVELAKKHSIKMLSLTDHDTMQGLSEAKKAAQLHKIALINGIELSTRVKQGACHLLGYFVSENNQAFNKIIQRTQATRYERNILIIKKLQALNIDITFEEINNNIKDNAVMGRPHIAVALINKNVVSSVQQAFQQYLGAKGAAYVKRDLLTPAEGIAAINEAGGWAFLAHPSSLYLSGVALEKFVGDLKDNGLKGIEVFNSVHSKKNVKLYQALAEKYGLLISGGSDYHGEAKPKVEIGRAWNGNHIYGNNISIDFFERYKLET